MERTVYLTRAAYLKSIEDALLAQLERVSSSEEEADKFIESLGIGHLLVHLPEKNAAEEKVAPKKKRISKK